MEEAQEAKEKKEADFKEVKKKKEAEFKEAKKEKRSGIQRGEERQDKDKRVVRHGSEQDLNSGSSAANVCHPDLWCHCRCSTPWFCYPRRLQVCQTTPYLQTSSNGNSS